MRTTVGPGLLGGMLVLALAACSSTGKPEAVADPRETTSTTVPRPVDDGEADDVVWQEFTRGGFVPVIDSARQVPTVTIYRDGRIFLTAHDPEGRDGPPVALEQGTVPQAELKAFLADAEASGLFDPDTDFGSPGVTDQPSTMVLLRTGDAPRQIDVYALGFGGDLPVGDVGEDQAERRSELNALLVRAAKLARDPVPYVPERVTATRFDASVVVSPAASSPTWPGPPLSAFPPPDDATQQSCLVIEGADAAAVYRADQANAETTWAVGGTVQPILIVPLLPGQEGCPPS